MPDRVNNPRNTRGKPFQPGNPGRPKGSRNKRTLLAEKIMAEDLESSVAFQAASALIFDGERQPSGYTEPLLHAQRLRLKMQ